MNKAVLKKAISKTIGLAGIAALSGSLQAASFDCAKAATPIEKIICESPAVSNLDDQLSIVYKKGLGIVNDKDSFKNEQLAWLKIRNACRDAACLIQSYQSRIAVLDTSSSAPQVVNTPKKTITFSLLEGEGYPLCKEYVDMLNKTQYTEIPACGPKILPEFKNFQEIAWTEITDKEEIIRIIKERMAIQQALNPTHSKQLYNPINRIKLISENGLKMYSYSIQINDDEIMDTVYRSYSHPKNDRKEFGHCEAVNSFFVEDSKITLQSITNQTFDPYKAYNFSGSNKLFIYGGDLYVTNYSGKTYYRINFEVYGIGNKKMCGILAK